MMRWMDRIGQACIDSLAVWAVLVVVVAMGAVALTEVVGWLLKGAGR